MIISFISGPGEPRACVRLVRVCAEERALRGVLEVQGDEEGGTPITSEWKKYSDLCIRHADLAYHFCMVRPGCCLAKFANTSFLTQFSDFLMVQPDHHCACNIIKQLMLPSVQRAIDAERRRFPLRRGRLHPGARPALQPVREAAGGGGRPERAESPLPQTQQVN